MQTRLWSRSLVLVSFAALAATAACGDDPATGDDDGTGTGTDAGRGDATTGGSSGSSGTSSGGTSSGGTSSGGTSSGGTSSGGTSSGALDDGGTDADSDASSDAETDAGMDAGVDAGAVFDLYDPAVVREFSIDLDADAITTLSDNAAANEKKWAHGTFHYGEEVYLDVGVRRKGSSTFRAYPQKMSLKIRFDKNLVGQHFHGATELTLNNTISDTTQIVERLSYHVFRTLGLPAQRANSVHMMLNTPSGVEDFGLYANIETPSQALIEHVYGANAKTLYEANSGDWTGGTGPKEKVFQAQGDDETYTDLPLLFAAINAAADATLLHDLDGVLDTAKFLRYSAAEAAVGHVDGYAYGEYGSHNYFLAGDATGKFTLLPWSTDLTFSNSIVTPNANTPKPANYMGGGGATTLLQRCKTVPACWTSYKTEVGAVLTAYEAMQLTTLATTWKTQIEPYINAATFDSKKRLGLRNTVNGGPSHASYVSNWTNENANLLTWIGARPALVRTQLGLP